jgi:colicin import membrane protein
MNMIFDIISSLLLHIFAIGLIFVFDSTSFSTPPPKITYITAVQAPAKQKSVLPNRAAQIEKPAKGVSNPPPTEVAPVQHNDAQSMTVNKEKPPTKTKTKTKTQTKTQKVKKQKKGTEEGEEKKKEEDRKKRAEDRAKRLAALGNKERKETSKDGTDNNSSNGTSGPIDAILGTYIEQCRQEILSNWNPLPTLIEENPDLQVVLEVKIDSSGTLSKPIIRTSSGNASFDRSAMIALRKTRRLPIAPAKYQKSAAGGIIITIAAQDKPL